MMKGSHQTYQNISYQKPQAFSSLGQKYQVNSNKESRDKGVLYQATVDTGGQQYLREPHLNHYGQSQIQQVFYPLPPEQQPLTFKKSQSFKKDHSYSNVKYESYIRRSTRPYRYNLFSSCDRTYNKCCFGETQEQVFENEFIAQHSNSLRSSFIYNN